MFLGGFGYNQNQNSPPSSERSSVWTNVYSPFRNSHMSLQDIMNQTSPLVKGTYGQLQEKAMHSGGKKIIGAGRTIKDYEDQLDALKKENFNLKLTIYYLEERMGSSSPTHNVITENIDLKVEVESLKKELIEKQELLTQAAKAFELIDEQKKILSQEQTTYQKSLEMERIKVAQLEAEIEEYKEKMSDCTLYCKETFGLTPEAIIENEEKLHQMDVLVSSLEAEVKQIKDSLEEERNWNQELEKERDELRKRLEQEVQYRNTVILEKDVEIDQLHERIKEMEDQILRKDGQVQQYRNELIEKDRLVKEKSAQLEEKVRACEELLIVSEKRKKQIDSLRMSLKSKDDSFADLSNKHRQLLSQFENNCLRRNSPPNSPSAVISLDLSPRLERRNQFQNSEQESHDKYYRTLSKTFDSDEHSQESENKDRELKKQEEINRQLLVKLSNLNKSNEEKEKELEVQKKGYRRALESIREMMERYHKLEKSYRELARKNERTNNSANSNSNSNGSPSMRRNIRDLYENPERDHDSKRRFDDMENKIDDLRCEIENIKAEKNRLEEQIHTESEELQGQLQTREQNIARLEQERDAIREELLEKISELNELKDICNKPPESPIRERKVLQQKMSQMNAELDEKNQKIEQLSKELQVKTQNLQKLVNTELWSKNKEIAKLHNHMSTSQCAEKCRDSVQLTNLISELNAIGINVKFTNEVIQLNYVNGNEEIDAKTMTDYVQKLVMQKKKLENEVDYFKWLKLVSKPDIIEEIKIDSKNEKTKRYCELLQAHLKDLMKFMRNLLKSNDVYDKEQHKNILQVLTKSRLISQDFVQSLRDESDGEDYLDLPSEEVKNSRMENPMDLLRSQMSTPTDSDVFSEPDRVVSMARMGLQEQQLNSKENTRLKLSKFSDSEDSSDYVPYQKMNEYNDDAISQILNLKQLISSLYSQLIALRTDFIEQVSIDNIHDDKLGPLIELVRQSQKCCENLQSILEKKFCECYSLKKANKHHSLRKSQRRNSKRRLVDVENMAQEITKQKSELVEYKESLDQKTSEIINSVNKENSLMKASIKRLEDDLAASKSNITILTKELDQLTLSHSHTLVENTKLTNDKLRLEHELRKYENSYDSTVRSLQEKCNREIDELCEKIDSHHNRMQELEVMNKELRRQVVACEASDSAPSSSGVSSMVPIESSSRPTYDDYNYHGYWWPMMAPSTSTRSKSSCSPDLGIESDGAATSTRPLQELSKSAESMTNLLSDIEQGRLRDDVSNESPLPTEGYEDVEALRKENEALKMRLLKTRKALEDTFRNLMTSNKNKKNVEKAIARHLVMTEDIWKKTKNLRTNV